MGVRLVGLGGALAISCLAALSAQSDVQIQSEFLTRAQAQPVFEALGERLPSAEEWPGWIAAADRATRARVAEGDETSIVNLLLFGTSFTRHPRITSRQLGANDISGALEGRLADLERALGDPGTNERIQFARLLLQEGAPVRARLVAMIDRAMREQETHARLIETAQALGDPSLEFAERSRMYRGRGLASDTSLRINFAIEQALRGLTPVMTRGADPTAIHRVAIIGPGLDFADKQEGHDFYPLQTIQPFAVIDSLVRLGFADAVTLQVTTFDVSVRVNEHLSHARRRAAEGSPYTIHAPLETGVPWTRDLVTYFETFGSAIGSPAPVTVPPGLGALRVRAVSVRPTFVERMRVADVNITAQQVSLASPDRFDLIIGTNIFLYYDRLQQGLAMSAIARMLRPGGFLLSNHALVEIPPVGMQSTGYSKTLYSEREEDGDVIVWYRKAIR